MHFYINTLSFLYSLRLPGGGYSPPSPPKSATAMIVKSVSYSEKCVLVAVCVEAQIHFHMCLQMCSICVSLLKGKLSSYLIVRVSKGEGSHG